LKLDGVSIKLTRSLKSEKPFVLYWTDNIANDWTETYDDMSTAFLRLATLVKCGELKWDTFFRFDQNEFAMNAEAFFNYATK
jgi:hypothetical protein